MRSVSAFAFSLLAGSLLAHGQASVTASRVADIQAGGGFTYANSDYTTNYIRGFMLYGNIDLTEHLGAEVNFHQLNDGSGSDVYERSYEFGARYILHLPVVHPYGKLLYGRGVFNFPNNSGNLAYNMYVLGAGIDAPITHRINLRLDYEHQSWLSGPGISNGLTPQLFSIGIAYHVPRGRHGLYN